MSPTKLYRPCYQYYLPFNDNRNRRGFLRLIHLRHLRVLQGMNLISPIVAIEGWTRYRSRLADGEQVSRDVTYRLTLHKYGYTHVAVAAAVLWSLLATSFDGFTDVGTDRRGGEIAAAAGVVEKGKEGCVHDTWCRRRARKVVRAGCDRNMLNNRRRSIMSQSWTMFEEEKVGRAWV